MKRKGDFQPKWEASSRRVGAPEKFIRNCAFAGLYQLGLSLAEIAEIAKLSVPSVHKIIKRYEKYIGERIRRPLGTNRGLTVGPKRPCVRCKRKPAAVHSWLCLACDYALNRKAA